MTDRNKAWKTIWSIPRLLKKTWYLVKNPQVSGSSKLLVFLIGFGYLLWPFDLIPDVPILGQIDDLGVIFLILNWFVNRSMPEDIIEAEYYFEDNEQNNNK
jgi:uncharacterized membrane protein YkvA (DUF1232 family)